MDQGLSSALVKREPTIRSIVPEQQRCEMPEQALWIERPHGPQASVGTRLGQAALAILWVSATAAFAWALYKVLSVEAPTTLQIVFLILSTLCFGWIALSSLIALLGFMTLLWARSPDSLEVPAP